MKTKIQINSIFGKLLFEYETENNTVAKTVNEAVRVASEKGERANLRYADLSYADLSYADLSYANLSSANLSSANLRYADLSYANLSSANLSSANLRYADLRYANLSSADLSSADLSSADLSSASTDKRYIQISCIGSAKRMTTYCFEDDIILCGCFKGSLEDFEKEVNKTHKNNAQYLKEYLGAINYLKSLK